MASSVASNSACLFLASNIARILIVFGFLDGQHEVLPIELCFVDFHLRNGFGRNSVRLIDPIVLGLGIIGLFLGKADFNVFLPAIVCAGVRCCGRLLLHLRLAVVDLADDLAGFNLLAFFHSEMDQHARLLGRQLDLPPRL